MRRYLFFRKAALERSESQAKLPNCFRAPKPCAMDSDIGRVRNTIAKTIEAFRNKEADILVGTQMIAKGHDFPDVTLVGIVLADIGLSLPSFRSSERAFELITQAVDEVGEPQKSARRSFRLIILPHMRFAWRPLRIMKPSLKKKCWLAEPSNIPLILF
jgi:hypothetical protein